MLYRLVAPVRRKGTSNSWFLKRIPTDVRERMVGMSLLVPVGPEVVRCNITAKTTTLRLSLRTAIPADVKVRQAEVAAYFETLWASMRSSKPIALTQQQCVALAGAMFRNWASTERGRTTAIESDTLKPGTAWRTIEAPFEPPAAWQAASDRLETLGDGEEPEELAPIFGPIVDHTLRDRGITAVDDASRAMILKAFLRAARDAFTVQKRQAEGNFSSAPEQDRYPEWQAPKPMAVVDQPKAVAKSGAKVSLRDLVDRWWSEAEQAGRSRSTHESYRATIHRFAAFLKHDDAAAVNQDDVLRFKDHRVASGASLKTIKDSDLVGLKAVFNFAVGNRILPENPVVGIKVLRPRRTLTREQGFVPEEATAILSKALRHGRAPNENPKTALAKRWVPWLCAYTGARVGEVVQLRKEDVKQVGKLWTITITPEAGTVKTGDMRQVVLHEHLIEQGFPDFVKDAKPGPLFLNVGPGASAEDIRGKWRATKNRLAEFAREVVPDERVKPNHGWRHLFRTVGREAGIEDSILDAVGGWAAGSVGERYGDVSLAAQARAFGKFPRFEAGT